MPELAPLAAGEGEDVELEGEVDADELTPPLLVWLLAEDAIGDEVETLI